MTEENTHGSLGHEEQEKVTEKEEGSILVIGDWFVDEHWVTGIHRSSTASRKGHTHLRSLHGLNSIVEAFCGAGRTAALLYSIKRKIIGIGIWNKDDTEYLKDMFNPDNIKGHNPHRAVRTMQEKPPIRDVVLLNLGKDLGREVGTSRIIRIYQATSNESVEFFRVDWEEEHRYSEEHAAPVYDLSDNAIEKFLAKPVNGQSASDAYIIISAAIEKNTLNAVVIKDLRRGVVCKQLLRRIIDTIPNIKKIPWFVSTKQWNPEWLALLKEVNLRVLLIPQVAAREAIKKNAVSCWLTREGFPDERAFETITALAEKVLIPSESDCREPLNIILLPEGYSVLSCEFNKNKKECRKEEKDTIVQVETTPGPLKVDMGMASVFLPAIVANLLKESEMKLEPLIKNSLAGTYKWVDYESSRIFNPDTWYDETKSLWVPENDDEPPLIADFTPKYKLFKREIEMTKWKSAMADIGVVTEGGGKEIQLWRAMTEIDGYVCCVPRKKDVLCDLSRDIDRYINEKRKNHFCCMLVAPPGSGKTFLVKQLSRKLGLRYLPFNITLMTNRNDLIDCFDTIVTTQAQEKDQPVLVFVDEINARLGGDTVYDAFLSPIEEGLYMRSNKAFLIEPCIWIFSGTGVMKNNKSEGSDKGAKASDFISRLTYGVIDIEPLGVTGNNTVKDDEYEEKRSVENVYLGVNLIKNRFPDVNKISQIVLYAFKYLPLDIRIRSLKNLVQQFTNIQYGKVRLANIRIENFMNIKGFNKAAFRIKRWQLSDGETFVSIR